LFFIILMVENALFPKLKLLNISVSEKKNSQSNSDVTQRTEEKIHRQNRVAFLFNPRRRYRLRENFVARSQRVFRRSR
jgi:hypothetical protein